MDIVTSCLSSYAWCGVSSCSSHERVLLHKRGHWTPSARYADACHTGEECAWCLRRQSGATVWMGKASRTASLRSPSNNASSIIVAPRLTAAAIYRHLSSGSFTSHGRCRAWHSSLSPDSARSRVAGPQHTRSTLSCDDEHFCRVCCSCLTRLTAMPQSLYNTLPSPRVSAVHTESVSRS